MLIYNNSKVMRCLFALACMMLLFISINGLSKQEIDEIMRRQQEEREKNFDKLPPNIVMFKFKKNKIHKMDQFSRILTEFLSTIGVTANIVNSNDDELMATIPRGKTFDKQIVLDNFADILESVDIADFTKNGGI